MAAARNRGRSGGEAKSDAFGLTTPTLTMFGGFTDPRGSVKATTNTCLAIPSKRIPTLILLDFSWDGHRKNMPEKLSIWLP